MKVYVLFRNDWHFVEGNSRELIDIYLHFKDAAEECALLNDEHSVQEENFGTEFEVIEKELK